MRTMTEKDETYNEGADSGASAAQWHETADSYHGYANRETWAFNLHWQNDQGMYERTLEDARNHLEFTNPDAGDYELGQVAVNLWRDAIDNWFEEDQTRRGYPDWLRAMAREVGSWWRIDYREVGEAVRESLDVES